MQTKQILWAIGTLVFMACAKNPATGNGEEKKEITEQKVTTTKPHSYGGWYCPDNLKGFPAVDLAHWKDVPVIADRLPSQEETRSGKSLIFVDQAQYPDAGPHKIQLPQLAKFYNHSAKREDLVIVIQAIHIQQDTIVGFRYLNGGNGSARIGEVDFLSSEDLSALPEYRFAQDSIQINASQEKIWEIITGNEYAKELQPTFDAKNNLPNDWRTRTNMNYSNAHSVTPTAQYAELLFGCYYIQNDYYSNYYTEKFLLLENSASGVTTLKWVCGPFLKDMEATKTELKNWATKVKELSEKK